MKSTYLSIDLDYWVHALRRGVSHRRGMKAFVQKALSLNVPCCLVAYHENMLRHIIKFNVQRVINVDYHSDIGHRTRRDAMQEGNWAAFVPRKREKVFEWRVPRDANMFLARCDDYDNPHTDVLDNPKVSGWSNVTVKVGLHGIPWEEIVGVGFCISLYWWDCGSVDDYSLRVLGRLFELVNNRRVACALAGGKESILDLSSPPSSSRTLWKLKGLTGNDGK